MKKQKQKILMQEISWIILVLVLVVGASLILNKVNHYYETRSPINSVLASTAEDSIIDTSQSNFQTTTQISSLLKRGYVGDYFISVPFNPNVEPAVVKIKEAPKVLGVKVEKKPYQAELVWKTTNVINIAPGKRITFEAKFKNTGTETWYNSGDHFIALNVTNPPGRASTFRDIFWPQYYRPAIMKTEVVKPGETGLFRFALTAPDKADEYVERFGLVAENLIWIEDGDLEIAMRVGNPKPYFQARKVKQAYQDITIEPGKSITFRVDFENTGSQTWYRDSAHFIALNVTDPPGRESIFRHIFWPQDYRPAIMKTEVVKPGEIGRFEFALQAPEAPGVYTEKFNLVAENLTWINGGYLEIPIIVAVKPEPVAEVQGEPDIRVGLYPTSSAVKITGNGQYEVRDTNNKLIGTYNKNVISTINYNANNNSYRLSVSGVKKTSSLPLRFIPKKNTILQLTNFENRPAWNAELNDNRFRGILEIRYAESTDRLWVINELPLESYLRGVAEAGNENDEDYLKALMIAARTYAMYHIQTGTKHDDENFTVDATYDQVYRGYGFELRAPNITQAILDTEGEMVTYENEIVVTPYFSQTDGRTRSWEEVWAGGPYPWLVSVPDPACQGMELLGHGVGMSAYGARAMAEDGEGYKDILQYYYTGIAIEKIY
ncbi:MAG: hypothetical protein COT24_04980 [Candidatus Kerfeldbacteria bacterium CG08_land_8_20_14_0_20_40_16]|uniref:Sporulation stage II protein D amidase enhancer LytB N-terminal domain-containing protein n=1 Tax=Candidatus Kerfeldbacteria bacterium CG08_land_8_20_14_0_20_40_16 TaxID=2014244 RepID=A0A2H0YWM3_9BACT|nr:MAG: hypothetical protein COT24_04980 [Candidatus Kerfeldbacteria bacterium CG08_land_8_20_14_0_20_40_16]